jgi:hypothetical protein
MRWCTDTQHASDYDEMPAGPSDAAMDAIAKTKRLDEPPEQAFAV